MGTHILLTTQTQGAQASGTFSGEPSDRTLQVTVEGSGSLHAKVTLEHSNDGIGWVTVATATVDGSGTTADSANYVSSAPYWRATVVELTGTQAKVTASVACA